MRKERIRNANRSREDLRGAREEKRDGVGG